MLSSRAPGAPTLARLEFAHLNRHRPGTRKNESAIGRWSEDSRCQTASPKLFAVTRATSTVVYGRFYRMRVAKSKEKTGRWERLGKKPAENTNDLRGLFFLTFASGP
jgi:hypothetical protein